MEVKKGFKQTEVGVIPEDWDVITVTEVCGFIVPGRNKPRVFSGDIPWVTTPDLKDGGSVSESRSGLCITKAEANAVGTKIVPKGSVLMSCAGELGIVALVQNDMFINQQLHAFLPTARVNGQYLRSALKTRMGYIDCIATKTAVPYLNKDNCNSIQIPFPTLAEQEAIAGALSDADAWIESLEQLIAKKRQIKQGAMQELLTGKRRLPEFSGEWDESQLAKIVDCAPSGTYGLERQSLNLIAIPVATTAQISSDDRWNEKPMNIRYFTSEQADTYGVSEGDLVVVKSSGSAASIQSGKMVLVDSVLAGKFLFSNFLMRLRPKTVCPSFLYYFLTSNRIKKLLPSLCEASTYPNIRINEYLEIRVPLPRIEEQAAIATVLSDMDTEIDSLESKLSKARELKQGMMHELLTGRIRLV